MVGRICNKSSSKAEDGMDLLLQAVRKKGRKKQRRRKKPS
jgi:hypothetical protein